MVLRNIRHRVERTRNKHSRAVLHDGTIIIRLARGLSKNEEKEHISDLLERMKEQALREQQRTLIDPFRPLLAGGMTQTVILATGKRIIFRLRPGERTAAKTIRNGWLVTVGPSLRRRGLHRLLWKLLCMSEHPRIADLVRERNDRALQVCIAETKLQFASSQWGSCSPKGIIMINAALLFVPPSILRYVIIHELAHRKKADHSPAFWEWVSLGMPSHERARKALSEYRLPNL